MPHVYRLHTGGSQTLDGWDASKQYGAQEINSIVDPSGATAGLPITSVPTPFASLELARNAFEICGAVDKNGAHHLVGESIYHKIVSFSLDTLEIFFNFHKFASLFDIIPWNANVQIEGLLQNPDPAHQRLGQTLRLYLNQDARAFNFGADTVFYLLNYKNGPAPLNIVGGTSSTSLAVASTNDLSYVDVPLSGNHNAYDSAPAAFRSLMERDPEFVRYVWTLSLQHGFSSNYPEVYKYVQESFRALDNPAFKADLRNLSTSDIQNYEPLTVGAAHVMLPGGVTLATYQAPSPDTVSDFTLKADFSYDKLPLVLPNALGYNEPGMRYVTGPWNPQTKAPYDDPRAMADRTLPGDNTQFPYLTANDVFQPFIIRTAFPVDDRSYFMGNYPNANKNGYSYLLPLKKEIFKYLSLDTLCGKTSGAHATNVFELRDAGTGVEAIIRLPIQKDKYITLRRIYHEIDEPNVEQNKGAVVVCTFDLYLYPSYHIVNADNIDKPQRVYLLDSDVTELTKYYDYSVEVFKAKQGIGDNLVSSVIKREDKRDKTLTSKVFVTNDEFDVIKVSNGFAEGMLIPQYAQVSNGPDAFEFAIDFGTTNTHVEYRVNNGQVTHPLEMSASDSAILAMHPVNSHYEELFDQNYLDLFLDAPFQEFMPVAFGAQEMTGFPLRTNICVSKSNAQNEGQNIRAKITLGDYSIGFHYERKQALSNNRTITNLKWLGDGNQPYVTSFFEELLMLIRSKVLRNGGSLKKTKITWFYPVSMEPFRLSQLQSEWSRLCQRLIDEQCPVQRVTESLAPFYYYKNTQGVNAAYRPVVLMDIGGGTTDFAVYEDNQPKLISSVRFAGNSIYGDFPGFGIQMNGFFHKYHESYLAKIKASDPDSLLKAYTEVVNGAVSADFVSFLYSLENNAELKKKGISISFSEDLKNDYSMKTSLLLFYVAEIYYLAHVLKTKGIGTPAYLTISGTGSKVLDLIGGQAELEGIAKIIFNDILQDNEKVELKRVSNPKEITCKGGLNMRSEDVIDDPEELRYCFEASPKLEGMQHIRLRDVDEQTIEEGVDFYDRFVDYFFSLNRKYSFEKKFGINTQRSFSEYREILLEHAHEDLAAVLDARKTERQDPEAELEDSIFFFPLAGGLNRLSYYISNQH